MTKIRQPAKERSEMTCSRARARKRESESEQERERGGGREMNADDDERWRVRGFRVPSRAFVQKSRDPAPRRRNAPVTRPVRGVSRIIHVLFAPSRSIPERKCGEGGKKKQRVSIAQRQRERDGENDRDR